MVDVKKEGFSVVVFPFLRTSSRVSIGSIEFRSTEDHEGLSREEKSAIKDISKMLFLQDNLRISKATYAIAREIPVEYDLRNDEGLANVRSIIAYLYTSPHEIYGVPLLHTEEVSMAIFTPSRVPASLVFPDFNVKSAGSPRKLDICGEVGYVRGYSGLYNFRHRFWVAKGSRVYGPKPHMTLNQQQDLAADIRMALDKRSNHFGNLLHLMNEPDRPLSRRILTAIHWFNQANCESSDDYLSLVSLAVAFEALLGLPQTDKKAKRLAESVDLLLGGVSRIDAWAYQFYQARSEIVHEGRSEKIRFIASDNRKVRRGPEYQTLVSCGMRIFRLCLATLLGGQRLAKDIGLEDIFVTNSQRFERLCAVFKDTKLEPHVRLKKAVPLIRAISDYRLISEPELKRDVIIASFRLAIETTIEANCGLPEESIAELKRRVDLTRASEHLTQLEAIPDIITFLVGDPGNPDEPLLETVRILTGTVWNYVFREYFSLKGKVSG